MEVILNELSTNNLFKLYEKFKIDFSTNNKKSILINNLKTFLVSNEYKENYLYNKNIKDIIDEKTNVNELDIKKLKKYQLQNICTEYNISGYYRKNTKELIELINNHFKSDNNNNKVDLDISKLNINEVKNYNIIKLIEICKINKIKNYSVNVNKQNLINLIIEKFNNKDIKIIKTINKNILVSEEHIWVLENYKWIINKDGYVVTKINKKSWRLHRYIFIEILKQIPNDDHIIDHINGDKLDNRKENLRILTKSENSRNRLKHKGSTSKYYGVSYDKNRNKWILNVTSSDNITYSCRYNEELHAAYHYNILVKELNLVYNKLNEIKSLKGFKRKKESRSNRSSLKIKERKAPQEIKRNSNNIPIIELFNKRRERVGETLVDEDIYFELMKHTWNLSIQGYVKGLTNDRKSIRLHRFVMNYTGNKIVDHINGDKLDNRKENLRIVDSKQNMQNKSKQSNCKSMYIGVNAQGKKWVATVYLNNKNKYIGTYTTEEEAARARDKIAKEENIKNNYCFKLNFPNE